MGDEYAGPVTVVAGGVTARADARLTGQVEPVDGRFHWGGRLAPSAELAGLIRAGARAATLRVEHGPWCDARLEEVDPWGGVRVSAVGSPPWTVGEPAVLDEAARSSARGRPVTLNLYRTGTGTPLVLIHGIGHRWQAWLPVIPALAEYHEVIAIDLPGFGASPPPARAVLGDMRASVQLLAAALSELGFDRPHVAGYSLGGAMSLEFAAAGLCASATAFSPAGFFTEAQRRHALRQLNAMRAGTFAPGPLIRATMASPRMRARSYGALVAHPERISPEVAYEDALAMRRGRGYRAVARASRGYRFDGVPAAPVTVAWGERDRIFPVTQLDVARTRLPGARHLVLPDCGHVPMTDDPGLVVATILGTTAPAGG